MDNDKATLGEILWAQADRRARQADLSAGLAVRAARNIDELKAIPSPKAIASPFSKGNGLTAKQVERVRFSTASIVGRRGYDEDEVDTFLVRVTAELVHGVAFSKAPTWKRGYDDVDVDAFLDLVEEQLRARQSGSAPRTAGYVPPAKRPAHLRRTRGT